MMKKDYAYAASYEDFVSLIEDCDDLNELRQIRLFAPIDKYQLAVFSSYIVGFTGTTLQQKLLKQLLSAQCVELREMSPSKNFYLAVQTNQIFYKYFIFFINFF